MSIGKTLARARRDAGLSIAEISRRTGIKLDVVDSIERDDYAACGGYSRARDNIRAIALALGVDAVPLFDTARREAGWIAGSQPSVPVVAVEASEPYIPEEEFWPVTADEDTAPITMGQPSEPVTADGPLHLIAPTETTAEASGQAWVAVADRHPLIWITLGAALLAGAALGGILLVLGTSGQVVRDTPVAGPQRSSGGHVVARPAGTRHPSPRHHASSPGPTAPASPATSRHAQALVPVGIAAFGPGGTGHGDSPQLARRALAGKAGAPWHSAWYTSPHFGNLQSGTGLLLYMGRTVTVTSARIALGNRSGANLALRIGNSPALASMPPVAHANDAGGVVHLTTAPTRGRYVLVWFSKLPPDQAGTFQASVYDITLRGHS